MLSKTVYTTYMKKIQVFLFFIQSKWKHMNDFFPQKRVCNYYRIFCYQKNFTKKKLISIRKKMLFFHKIKQFLGDSHEFVYLDIIANSVYEAFFVSQRKRICFECLYGLGRYFSCLIVILLFEIIGCLFFGHFPKVPCKKILLQTHQHIRYVLHNRLATPRCPTFKSSFFFSTSLSFLKLFPFSLFMMEAALAPIGDWKKLLVVVFLFASSWFTECDALWIFKQTRKICHYDSMNNIINQWLFSRKN